MGAERCRAREIGPSSTAHPTHLVGKAPGAIVPPAPLLVHRDRLLPPTKPSGTATALAGAPALTDPLGPVGVHTRREALARARELQLIPH